MQKLDIDKVDLDSQVAMLLSAYESVFIGKSGNYLSTPITTGKRLFSVLLANDVHDREELKAKLGDAAAKKIQNRIIEENCQSGAYFATFLRSRGLLNVIDPAKFYAIHFGQDHYNHFWVNLIEKKICSVHFNQDWEYSQGCTTEYLAAVRHNVPTYDHLSAPLSASIAIDKMCAALKYMTDCGFSEANYSLLSKNLAQLQEFSKIDKQT